MMKSVLSVAGALLILTFTAVPNVGLAIPSQASTQEQPKEKSKTFTGTVTKKGSDFFLNDSANKTSYMLDDAQKASQFEGKKVKVTGTVDTASNTIHVETIAELA